MSPLMDVFSLLLEAKNFGNSAWTLYTADVLNFTVAALSF